MDWESNVSRLYRIKLKQFEDCKKRLEGIEADYEAVSLKLEYTTDRADRNALERQLAAIAQDMERLAQHCDQLEAGLKAITESVGIPIQSDGTADKFQPLIDILSPYEPTIRANRETAYHSVRPVDWLHPMSATLQGMLAELKDMQPDPMDCPAILKFVAYLIADVQVPEMLSKQLQQWAEQNNFATVLERIRQSLVVNSSPDNERQTHSYLMVVVERSETANQQKEARYFVKAWFILDGQTTLSRKATGFEPLIIPGALEDAEKSFTVDEIEGLLKAFLAQSCNKCLSQRRLPENLTIELFLPFDLLNHPVDQWVMEDLDDECSMSEPVGFQYPLLIRSSERLRRTYFSKRGATWKDKWKQVRQKMQMRSPEGEMLHGFVSGDGVSVKRLFQQLSQPQMIGLKLAQGPLSIGKESVFAALQSSATPIAVWVRQPISSIDCISAVDQLLGYDICDIPERVKQHRQAAFPVERDRHIGHHLSLLWEDFDRLPPDLDYQVA
jgi:hypothetical protein